MLILNWGYQKFILLLDSSTLKEGEVERFVTMSVKLIKRVIKKKKDEKKKEKERKIGYGVCFPSFPRLLKLSPNRQDKFINPFTEARRQTSKKRRKWFKGYYFTTLSCLFTRTHHTILHCFIFFINEMTFVLYLSLFISNKVLLK